MNHGEPLKIMTYNLRFDNDRDLYPWSARRQLMIELIADSAPAVLGTQEGLRHQLDDISLGLPNYYAWLGNSRGADDEYCAVFYDSRRLQVVALTERWFSATPEVAGSISWGACPRIMTAVTFRDRESGDEFLVINTHLDHMSVRARRFAADYLVSFTRIAADGRPTVVMGDFNTAARKSAVYQRLCETPLTDTFEASRTTGLDRPSFNNYQPPPAIGPRIDWVLVSPEIAVDSAQVNTRDFDGRYASDHLPVEATVRVPRSLQRVGAAGRLGKIPLPLRLSLEVD
ncbi:MAG: endonuclease/exonuclease/phosphatase family protein [Propionibacteriaceae bacterium]|nr:endonuclease/exonuclease/phosphatase family protein [Propionibacteriaceae bacterium]